jgi:hypothetical protein
LAFSRQSRQSASAGGPVTSSEKVQQSKSKVIKRFRRIYAHWLDGEWHKVANHNRPANEPRSLVSIAEGELKLHALFGTRIAISDVQLTDSPVMAEIFYDPAFRHYLGQDPHFLTLVTRMREGVSNPRFASATNGFGRAQNKGWTTSLPADVELIKRFADTICEDEDRIVEHFLADGSLKHFLKDGSWGPARVIKENPKHQKMLEGIVHGVCHFTIENGGKLDSPIPNDQSYLHIFEKALETSRGGDNCGRLEEVYHAVQKIADRDEFRAGRSAVGRFFDLDQPDRRKWTDDQKRQWNSVVHAWNSNVADTVAASESIAPLPSAVFPIRGEITDLTGPFIAEKDTVYSIDHEKFPPLRFDPEKLTWKEIAAIVNKDKVMVARNEFQNALEIGSSDNIQHWAHELVQNLNPELASFATPHEALWIKARKIASLVQPVAKAASAAAPLVVSVANSVDRNLGELIEALHPEEIFEASSNFCETTTIYAEGHLGFTEMKKVDVLNTLREFEARVNTTLSRPGRTQ